MKKYFLLPALTILLTHTTYAQVLCVQCFNQNAALNPGATNLLKNGGLENYTGRYYICSKSGLYDNTIISNWVCTGGGSLTYAHMCNDTSNFVLSYVPQGHT